MAIARRNLSGFAMHFKLGLYSNMLTGGFVKQGLRHGTFDAIRQRLRQRADELLFLQHKVTAKVRSTLESQHWRATP